VEGLGWGRGGKADGKGREGEWRGGKRRAAKLLLNYGPSEPCYVMHCLHAVSQEASRTGTVE